MHMNKDYTPTGTELASYIQVIQLEKVLKLARVEQHTSAISLALWQLTHIAQTTGMVSDMLDGVEYE